MSSRYGALYQTIDFLERSIPRRKVNEQLPPLFQRLLTLLKDLDSVQERNPFLTLAFQTGGSLTVFYRGTQLFSLYPHTTHIRLGIRTDPQVESRGELLAAISRHDGLFAEKIASPIDFIAQWRCGDRELDVLQRHVEELPVETVAMLVTEARHPRHFPGEVRQAALQDFMRNGSYCRGVGRKRHKVGAEPIEFDHILPHSKGGASSALNIEVLCAECNRRKRDLAI